MHKACDLCGTGDPEHLLDSPLLDGSLVRCRNCGLVYVGTRRSDFTFADGADEERSHKLAAQVATLGLVDHHVEDAERPLRIRADQERLQRLLGHVGRRDSLLDVGAATGTFLAVAQTTFPEAAGIEPDPITSAQARAAGLNVRTGTLAGIEQSGFDAITMLHVIEHLDSPHETLERVAELLRPGGTVLIETPTVDNVWFRLAPTRWRQLIPDHYFFFSRPTLERLLRECGLEPIEYHSRAARQRPLRCRPPAARRVAGIQDASANADSTPR